MKYFLIIMFSIFIFSIFYTINTKPNIYVNKAIVKYYLKDPNVKEKGYYIEPLNCMNEKFYLSNNTLTNSQSTNFIDNTLMYLVFQKNIKELNPKVGDTITIHF